MQNPVELKAELHKTASASKVIFYPILRKNAMVGVSLTIAFFLVLQ